MNEIAQQLGDSVETVVRNYVKPMMPSQASIDSVFHNGSSNGSRNTGETRGREGYQVGVVDGAPEDAVAEYPRITKGLLSDDPKALSDFKTPTKSLYRRGLSALAFTQRGL